MNFSIYFLLFVALTWAAPVAEHDESCEMQWVTVYADATGTSALTGQTGIPLAGAGNQEASPAGGNTSSPSATGAATESAPSTESSSSASPGSNGTTTTSQAGQAGIPIDGAHLSAPVSNVAVPADAKVYTPPGKTISGKAFEAWIKTQTAAKPTSKWLKLAAGVYSIDCSDGIVFSFMDGLNEQWTMDLRGVTFLVAGTCQAIYINQCEDFTIYGGTMWFDAGEIWTQAKVTDITDIGSGSSTVTCVVEDGYNLTTWRSAGPRNLNAVDASNPNDYVRPPGLNYWFASDYNFDNLDSKRTWTMKVVTANVPLKGQYNLHDYCCIFSLLFSCTAVLANHLLISRLHHDPANWHFTGQHHWQRE